MNNKLDYSSIIRWVGGRKNLLGFIQIGIALILLFFGPYLLRDTTPDMARVILDKVESLIVYGIGFVVGIIGVVDIARVIKGDVNSSSNSSSNPPSEILEDK